MVTKKEMGRAWSAAFAQACRDGGLRTTGGYGYLADEVYVATLIGFVTPWRSQARTGWHVQVKPLALDPVLWECFMPDVDLGGERRRLSHRVAGAFTCSGRTVGRAHGLAAADVDLPGLATRMVDDFLMTRAAFVAEVPDLAAFEKECRPTSTASTRNIELLPYALTLMALGRYSAAAEVVEAARRKPPATDGQLMSNRAGDTVFDCLARECERRRG